MTLKPLIALTVIHQSLEPGVAADPVKKTPAVPPKGRVVQPFKKTGVAFFAASEEQQQELFNLGCVAVAPEGTPLDPEAVVAGAAPVKKAAPAAKPKAPAAKKPAEAAADEDADKADDGNGMV